MALAAVMVVPHCPSSLGGSSGPTNPTCVAGTNGAVNGSYYVMNRNEVDELVLGANKATDVKRMPAPRLDARPLEGRR